MKRCLSNSFSQSLISITLGIFTRLGYLVCKPAAHCFIVVFDLSVRDAQDEEAERPQLSIACFIGACPVLPAVAIVVYLDNQIKPNANKVNADARVDRDLCSIPDLQAIKHVGYAPFVDGRDVIDPRSVLLLWSVDYIAFRHKNTRLSDWRASRGTGYGRILPAMTSLPLVLATCLRGVASTPQAFYCLIIARTCLFYKHFSAPVDILRSA